MSTQPPTSSKLHNFIQFSVMFIACILGSIAIFIFAVGMETGNKIIETMMRSLVDHALIVIGVFAAFNVFIFILYRNRKGTHS